MRPDILRIGGAFALLLAGLYLASTVVTFAADVPIFDDDDTAGLLTDLDDNAALFITGSVMEMLGPLLLAPVLLGMFFTVREEDRPYFALAGAFFGLFSVASVTGLAFAIILTGLASDFVKATEPDRTALLRDGETLQNVFLILSGGAAYFLFALGMLTSGVLAVRSRFFPRWFAIATVVVGALGLIVIVSWVFMIPGRVLWLLISGVFMLRRSRTESAAVAAPAPSQATA